MRALWPLRLLNSLVVSKPVPAFRLPSLPEVVEQARREWLFAQSYYNTVSDTDLVDHAVYLILAAEKKYMYLLKKARREGVTFSPYEAINH